VNKNKKKEGDIMKNKKNTKKAFEGMQASLRKMRRNDPIQFDVLFNDWKRLREAKK
jgi:hypothetical protein